MLFIALIKGTLFKFHLIETNYMLPVMSDAI